ncbi:hypothetical protein Z042_26310 [Chania multitudinisentens RB-25]|uniref:Uncharacterized protein n=2 Tax=Chania TaxID=1745211 RepID=A0A0D4ZYG9_9GAMM|nr:hypothetical protein Z042_26310 [Chania multitudinisentens RB-25]
MTPSTLPNKLWRAASEVKSFVEKFPDGVILADVKSKVEAYKALNRKEQYALMDFLQARESILMLECRPLSAKHPIIMLRHKRFGYPKTIPGYEFPLCPLPKIALNNQPSPNDTKPKEQVMAQEIKATPELLRKQAEELLKAAEKAEKQASESDLFNKKLAPVKLEVLQAVGAIQRKFDEMMDCMSTLEKVAAKLKELSA